MMRTSIDSVTATPTVSPVSSLMRREGPSNKILLGFSKSIGELQNCCRPELNIGLQGCYVRPHFPTTGDGDQACRAAPADRGRVVRRSSSICQGRRAARTARPLQPGVL